MLPQQGRAQASRVAPSPWPGGGQANRCRWNMWQPPRAPTSKLAIRPPTALSLSALRRPLCLIGRLADQSAAPTGFTLLCSRCAGFGFRDLLCLPFVPGRPVFSSSPRSPSSTGHGLTSVPSAVGPSSPPASPHHHRRGEHTSKQNLSDPGRVLSATPALNSTTPPSRDHLDFEALGRRRGTARPDQLLNSSIPRTL
jgi:hypothetical protein